MPSEQRAATGNGRNLKFNYNEETTTYHERKKSCKYAAFIN